MIPDVGQAFSFDTFGWAEKQVHMPTSDQKQDRTCPYNSRLVRCLKTRFAIHQHVAVVPDIISFRLPNFRWAQ
jgi:hypothetical protein